MSTGITRPSPQGLEFIKRFQGLSLEKYRDAEGLWVIGYGHLIREGERFDGCLTHAQAEMLFEQDVENYRQWLCQGINAPLAQHQFDALLSLAFSLGLEGVRQSAIVQAINRRDFNAALAEWRREGEQQSSLALQRQAEASLFQCAGL